jgi:hypothetical protein
MGGWIGGQADYVMVPFADFNLLRLGRDPAQAMDKILVPRAPFLISPLNETITFLFYTAHSNHALLHASLHS